MNLIKKLIAIAIALTLMLSLVGCGEKSKEIPNVFGVDFNDAIEILEAEGFEVQAVETDAKSILNNLYSEYDGSPQYYGDRPESFEKGAVFKINNYTQDGVGQIYDNDDMYDEHMIDEDGKIVIYYAKEAYSGSDGAKDNNEDLNQTTTKKPTTTKKKTTKSESSVDWREFLVEYEEWVDDYIEIVKKYNNNPSDMSILSDYTEMVSEMTEWTDKADDVELSITDTDEALEYSQELLRIAGKLAKVSE